MVQPRKRKEVATLRQSRTPAKVLQSTSTDPPCTHSGLLDSTIPYAGPVHFVLVGLAALRGESDTYETTNAQFGSRGPCRPLPEFGPSTGLAPSRPPRGYGHFTDR